MTGDVGKRDQNSIPVLLATSNVDGVSIVAVYADPVTHRLLVSGTGGGTPGGSDTQVQFNDGGTFGGDAGFVYNKTTNTVTLDVIQLTNTGLKVLDTDASHCLSIVPGSNLSAARTFTITTGDANRTLSLGADLTIPADPNADTILFWDDSAGATAWLTLGTGLSITGTTISASSIPGGSSTQLQYNNVGAFGGISGATTDGTTVTFASANMIATRPKFITSVDDTNGNEIFKITATGSAVNEFTITNAATTANPQLSATGGDSNIGLDFLVKGTGVYRFLATTSGPTEIRWFEDADNGTNYIGIIAPSSLAADRTLTLPDATDTIAVLAASQAFTNKTYNGLTLTSTTGTFTLTNGKTLTVQNTLTFAGTDSTTITFQGTDTYVGRTTTDTLTNKTLTAPKFANAGFIADANGNELFIFTTTASAVNEITFANAATGANPTFTASGGDANVGINFQVKGTGVYRFLSTSSGPTEVRWFEDTDNGSNYIGIIAPASLSADRTLTLPDVTSTLAAIGLAQTWTAAQTLGSQLLIATSPKFVTDISDTNGNEIYKITATASAVNEITIANAATGNNPSYTASGGDSNVGIDWVAKGTGTFNFKGNSTQAAIIRLYEDTDDGSNYSSFKSPALAANLDYTLPNAHTTNGYLKNDGSGGLSWATISAGGGGYSFVSYTTATTASSVTVSSLDLGTDKLYRVIVQVDTRSASGTFRIAINNETSSTHYRTYHGYKVGTGAISGVANGTAAFIMGGSGPNTDRHFMTMEFMQFSAVRPRAMYQYSGFAGAQATDNEIVHGLWENSDNTNITRIDFSVNTGTADFRVWVFKGATS